MPDKNRPDIKFSDLCCEVEIEGHVLNVEIYNVDNESGWLLDVENEFGTLTAPQEPFISDGLAWRDFERLCDEEGLKAFMSKKDLKKLS